ncbi:SRPBCC family protein [Cellulomonas fengjieae]|uniref:SRPBCC family protein n=1 Tax=Cellulomonas fengjieae TaxID=2819978 RepID=UPI001AAEC55C|nr:SRPBCC family protein [Cellulomonas fengjieae]MBO3103079.1 SRPBCC family protein [Cellulomonas fengjieae]
MATDLWGVLTPTGTGVTVRFERRFATAPEDLWSCITDPDRLRRWLGPVYGDLRVGGRYELRMGDDVAGSPQNAAGEVVECDPPARLLLTWLFPGEPESRVSVEVRAEGGGALLVLEHLGLEEAAARGYGSGWHASLDQLDDHVAGRTVRPWEDLYRAALPRYRQEA